MNSFQILNKDNQPLTMNELDKSAAEFWGVEVDEKWYANPYKRQVPPEGLEGSELFKFEMEEEMRCASMPNWYDKIGWNIANQGRATTVDSWNNVVATLTSIHSTSIILNTDYTLPKIDVTPYGTFMPNDLINRLVVLVNHLTPYINLIRHWESLGYKPKQIKEED